MTSAKHRAVLVTAATGVALGTTPATTHAGGLPPPFPRTIAILNSTSQIQASRFEVATRAVAGKMRVDVRLAATAVGRERALVISVAPCTGGTATSPLCRPTAHARIAIHTTGTAVTQSFLVARPAARRDAVRVTLTPAGIAVPYRPQNVGGGGGMGEILLNAGTWRFKQGTRWGIDEPALAGVRANAVKFNSRTYAWTGLAAADTPVSTQIGYEGQAPPRWTFASTMRAAKPYSFRRTPTSPIQEPRAAPRAFSFRADSGTAALFSVRVPLPAWSGR
jgi:hypothetical protein